MRGASEFMRSMAQRRRSSGLNSSYRATSHSNITAIGKQLTARQFSGRLTSGGVVETDETLGEQSQPLTTAALEVDAVQVYEGLKDSDAVSVEISGHVTLEMDGTCTRSQPDGADSNAYPGLSV